MRHTRADLDLNRRTLAQVFPDVLGAPKAGGKALDGTELTLWLRRLDCREAANLCWGTL